MTPLREDLVWRLSAPEAASYTLSDGPDPIDLKGCTFMLQARLYTGQPGAPYVALGMAGEGLPGFRITDAEAGEFTLTPPTSTQLLAIPRSGEVGANNELAYEILLIDPNGTPEPFMEGNVILVTGVVR